MHYKYAVYTLYDTSMYNKTKIETVIHINEHTNNNREKTEWLWRVNLLYRVVNLNPICILHLIQLSRDYAFNDFMIRRGLIVIDKRKLILVIEAV